MDRYKLNQHLRVNVARARPEQLAGMKEAQYGAAAVGQQLAEPCYPFGDFVDLLPLV